MWPSARNRTARGTCRAAQGTRARCAARSCTLMTQPAPCTSSPTNDMHSPCTPRCAPPALLALTPAELPPLSDCSPRAGLNRLVMPRPPAPGSQRGLASPRQRLRLVCLSHPPAHRATRADRLHLEPSILWPPLIVAAAQLHCSLLLLSCVATQACRLGFTMS